MSVVCRPCQQPSERERDNIVCTWCRDKFWPTWKPWTQTGLESTWWDAKARWVSTINVASEKKWASTINVASEKKKLLLTLFFVFKPLFFVVHPMLLRKSWKGAAYCQIYFCMLYVLTVHLKFPYDQQDKSTNSGVFISGLDYLLCFGAVLPFSAFCSNLSQMYVWFDISISGAI